MADFLRGLGLGPEYGGEFKAQDIDPDARPMGRFYQSRPGGQSEWPTKQDWQKAGLRCQKPIDVNIKEYEPDEEDEGAPLLRQSLGNTRPGKSGSMNFNVYFAVVNILLPPFVFGYIFTLLCFNLHFMYPTMVWACALLGLIPVLLSHRAMRRSSSNATSDARWCKLTFLLLSLSAVLGLVGGEICYWFFFHNYYLVESMKVYTNISPAEAGGQRLMDAGIIHFSEDTRLATEMGMSFTNWDTYCVAPVTVKGQELASYDIWAVGTNCCRTADPVFNCGQYSNSKVRAGIRQVSEEHRQFFRLAVQQAEAAYDIQANHPIFIYWVQDPTHAVEDFFITGFRHWMLSLMCHFCLNAAVIAMFFLAFRPNRSPASISTLGEPA